MEKWASQSVHFMNCIQPHAPTHCRMSSGSKRKPADEPNGGSTKTPKLAGAGSDGEDDYLMARANGTGPSACGRCRVFHQLGPKLEEFLAAIPKNDLHVHLDGSCRLSTLIELVLTHGVELPVYTEEGLREKVFKENYANLVDYLRGFPLIVRVMQ